MALETFGYIDDLDPSSPDGATEYVSQGDDHIRGIKLTLQNSFPNLTGAVTATQAELNQLAGTTVSAYAKTMLDDGDEATMRTTLGLGDAAVLDVSNPTTVDDSGTVTSAASGTTVATLNLGTVVAGEVFLLQHQATIGVSSVASASVGYTVQKESGTGAASFSGDGATSTINTYRQDLTLSQISQSGCSLLLVSTSGTLVISLRTYTSSGTLTLTGRLRAVKLVTLA